MITYVDSSVLARAYLPDEPGHANASAILADGENLLVTGTWTRIEVSGALVRAARRGRRGDPQALLDALDFALGVDGAVTVLSAPQAEVERAALVLSRAHGLRAMDAWHLAVAEIALPPLAAGGRMAFATRDQLQARVAASLGFVAA